MVHRVSTDLHTMADRKFRSESIDRMEEVFAHTDERVLMAQKVLLTRFA